MSAPTERVYIGMGANLQHPEQQLLVAIECLRAMPWLSNIDASALYETPPWGNTEQPVFINAVVAADCAASPQSLLDALLQTERELGRVRDNTRWSPRTIDLDVLFYGVRSLQTSGLWIPHPHAHERAFVLIPLIEIATRLNDPRLAVWTAQLSKLPAVDVVRLQPQSRSTASA